MKFLIDQQLPPALARYIQSQGHVAHHTREIGFEEAGDDIIWRHVSVNELILVSKDEDFYFLVSHPKNKGKLLWVRIGNSRTQNLLEIFRQHLPSAIAAFESGSTIVEIR